tara:strand:+ start:517 stop:633 length:117 start_codon:yes stop_codon:yes gene_type:complete
MRLMVDRNVNLAQLLGLVVLTGQSASMGDATLNTVASP